MGRNRKVNDIIRQGFGRAPSTEAEDRKQSGIKPTEDMSNRELTAEVTILTSRLTDAAEELAARVPDEDEEEEESESKDGPTSQVLKGGSSGGTHGTRSAGGL